MQPPPDSLYCNALEPLVAEEVHRQLQSLPSRLVQYIKPAEAIAYALNRLPPFSQVLNSVTKLYILAYISLALSKNAYPERSRSIQWT
jgi:hypothetical protein